MDLHFGVSPYANVIFDLLYYFTLYYFRYLPSISQELKMLFNMDDKDSNEWIVERGDEIGVWIPLSSNKLILSVKRTQLMRYNTCLGAGSLLRCDSIPMY